MNSNERTALINRQLVNLLSIYAAPKHLETTAKQADAISRLAESLNKRFPNDTTEDHIIGTFERAGHSLSGSHKKNTWPLPPEITKAVVAGMGSEIKMQNALDNTQTLEQAIKIFRGETGGANLDRFKGRAYGHYNQSWVALEFIKAGLLKDERDAYWRGFDMADKMYKVHNQRMTLDEWNNHIRIMASIKNCTEEEARDHELFSENPHSEDTLPIEMINYKRSLSLHSL